MRRQEHRRAVYELPPERKTLGELGWSYNTRLPRREILELGTLKYIDAREDALLLGPLGTGKSHVAKALALMAIERGYKVHYREVHDLIEDITEARELGTLRKYRAQLKAEPPRHLLGQRSGRIVLQFIEEGVGSSADLPVS